MTTESPVTYVLNGFNPQWPHSVSFLSRTSFLAHSSPKCPHNILWCLRLPVEPACGLCPHASAGGRLMRKEKVPGSPVIGRCPPAPTSNFERPLPTSRDRFRLPPPQGAEQGQEKPLGSLCQAGMSYSNSEARVQSSPDSKEIQASKPCGFLAPSFRQRGGSASVSC